MFYVCNRQWIGEKARMLDKPRFKLWYTEKNKTRNRVRVIIDASLIHEVVCVIRKGSGIIALKSMLRKEIIIIISVHAPQMDLQEAIKVRF